MLDLWACFVIEEQYCLDACSVHVVYIVHCDRSIRRYVPYVIAEYVNVRLEMQAP